MACFDGESRENGVRKKARDRSRREEERRKKKKNEKSYDWFC